MIILGFIIGIAIIVSFTAICVGFVSADEHSQSMFNMDDEDTKKIFYGWSMIPGFGLGEELAKKINN